MHTHELIGQTITDIFVWSSTEVGDLDEAEVFIKLDNDVIVGVPADFDESNLEKPLRENAESVFANLNEIPHHLR